MIKGSNGRFLAHRQAIESTFCRNAGLGLVALTTWPGGREPPRRRTLMLYWLADFSDHVRPAERLPLHHLPHRRRDRHRAAVRLPVRTRHHRLLRVKQGKGQPIREDGPQSHLKEDGTPTMGGLMILSGMTVVDPAVGQPVQPLCLDRARRDASLSALIGFYDDYLKVTKQTHIGLLRASSRLGVGVVGRAAIACLRSSCGSASRAFLDAR